MNPAADTLRTLVSRDPDWDRVAWETVRSLPPRRIACFRRNNAVGKDAGYGRGGSNFEDVRGLRAGFPVASEREGNSFRGLFAWSTLQDRGGWQPVVRSRGATHRRPAPTNRVVAAWK